MRWRRRTAGRGERSSGGRDGDRREDQPRSNPWFNHRMQRGGVRVRDDGWVTGAARVTRDVRRQDEDACGLIVNSVPSRRLSSAQLKYPLFAVFVALVTTPHVLGDEPKKNSLKAQGQYATVNGLKMYYEAHGSGDPVVLLHGSFMTITNNWTEWIGELSKTRKVIVVEMQGHGRTADIKRDFSYENLADDVAALLGHLTIPSADLIGYSMGGGVAMQCAIRHPEQVRKVVSISAVFRHDGWVKEGLDMFPQVTAETFKGSPIASEYKKLSPTPDEFPNFVKRVIAMDLKPYDFGAAKLKATKAPMFFIHGDSDGVRLEHISEMYRLKGEEIFGDMRPRSASRLAILPNTTHITLMDRMLVIVPMVNGFFDAKPQKQK